MNAFGKPPDDVAALMLSSPYPPPPMPELVLPSVRASKPPPTQATGAGDVGGGGGDSGGDQSDPDEDNLIDLNCATGAYWHIRNVITKSKFGRRHKQPKPILEYLNIKYVEANFRSIGVARRLSKNNLMEVTVEVQAMENWYNNKRCIISGSEYIQNLCIPLFCHLYMNIYKHNRHEDMVLFLKKFEHIFLNSSCCILIDELKTLNDFNNLPPTLDSLRKHKIVYTCTPQFLAGFCKLLNRHHLIKTVFHEWVEIEFDTRKNPHKVFDSYMLKNVQGVKTKLNFNSKEDISKKINIPGVSSDYLNNKEPTTTQKNDPIFDTQRPSTSKEIHKSLQEETQSCKDQPKVINVNSLPSTNDNDMLLKNHHSVNDPEIDKNIDDQRPSTSREFQKYNNQEPQPRKSQPTIINADLSSSESDNENKTSIPKKHRNIKKSKVNKGDESSDNSSEDNEQESRCSKDSSPEKELDKKSTFPIKSSFVDSSEESSGESYCSRYSFYDEEATMRSYFKEQKKSTEYLQKKAENLMKHTNVTKIDVKNIDEDLCSTRQIILTNCNKLLCTLLSSHHKYVAAGSMDSIIYVWERSNLSYLTDIQNKIENGVHTKSQDENLVEFLDKSEAKMLRGHGGSIFDLAEIASAKILLSASHDKTFRAWDLETKLCLEVFDEHEHRTWCIAACPLTSQIITGTCEGASCLWFLKYKRPLRFFVGHVDDVLVVKFHPNKVLIATGSSDKTVRIFEVVSGDCIRVLTGHTDYITCLEFHPLNSSLLASASGNGEILLWNTTKCSIIWKLRVDNMLVSDLAWFNDDILLASLTTGIILKCDTREDYIKSSKSVKGFTTKFDRLMSLRIYDSIVYTIGVPGKTNIQKTSSVKQRARIINQTENDSQHQELKSPREFSVSSKLFFPQPSFENNSNSIRPLRRSNSAVINNSSVEFLKMDLQRSPYHVSHSDISRLSSDSQSNNIRIVHTSSTKSSTSLSLLKNDLLSTHQNDVQVANSNSSQMNVQSKNSHILKQNAKSTNINAPKKPHVSLQSQITNVQHKLGKNNSTLSTKIQNLQLQSNIHIASTNIQKPQQVSQIQSVIQPRITTQLLQKNNLQPEQQLQIQQSVGSNFQLANTNNIQQPSFQQLRPNTLLTKVNVQQLKSPQQTSIRLANMNIPQSSNENIPRTSPQILTIRHQKSKTNQPSLENTEEDARVRQVVMASLLEKNPEMFSRGQTVIGEITRSQSTTQSLNTTAFNSEIELQQNESR